MRYGGFRYSYWWQFRLDCGCEIWNSMVGHGQILSRGNQVYCSRACGGRAFGLRNHWYWCHLNIILNVSCVFVSLKFCMWKVPDHGAALPFEQTDELETLLQFLVVGLGGASGSSAVHLPPQYFADELCLQHTRVCTPPFLPVTFVSLKRTSRCVSTPSCLRVLLLIGTAWGETNRGVLRSVFLTSHCDTSNASISAYLQNKFPGFFPPPHTHTHPHHLSTVQTCSPPPWLVMEGLSRSKCCYNPASRSYKHSSPFLPLSLSPSLSHTHSPLSLPLSLTHTLSVSLSLSVGVRDCSIWMSAAMQGILGTLLWTWRRKEREGILCYIILV